MAAASARGAPRGERRKGQRLDIPIDHAGPYEIAIGEARLPNGVLTAADFALVEHWPTGVSIFDGGVGLEIRSLDDGEVEALAGRTVARGCLRGCRPGSCL